MPNAQDGLYTSRLHRELSIAVSTESISHATIDSSIYPGAIPQVDSRSMLKKIIAMKNNFFTKQKKSSNSRMNNNDIYHVAPGLSAEVGEFTDAVTSDNDIQTHNLHIVNNKDQIVALPDTYDTATRESAEQYIIDESHCPTALKKRGAKLLILTLTSNRPEKNTKRIKKFFKRSTKSASENSKGSKRNTSQANIQTDVNILDANVSAVEETHIADECNRTVKVKMSSVRKVMKRGRNVISSIFKHNKKPAQIEYSDVVADRTDHNGEEDGEAEATLANLLPLPLMHTQSSSDDVFELLSDRASLPGTVADDDGD